MQRLCRSLVEALLDDGVKEAAEEVEPLRLLDLAITIGIEGGEELVDLGFTLGGVGVVGETNTLRGELLDLLSVDFTIAVEVELVESLFSGGESSGSGGSDVLLVFSTESFHLRDFFLSLILSLQLIKDIIDRNL